MRRFLVVMSLVGCSSRGAIRNAPSDAGVQHSYVVPFEKARMAAMAALGELGYSVRDDKPMGPKWRLLGAHRATESSPARIARVLLEHQERQIVAWVLVGGKIDTPEERANCAIAAEDIHRRIENRVR